MEAFKTLSDGDLINDLHIQVREERKVTAQVIRLLEEVDRRKLYLKMGFGSLIEFCVKELKYSESSSYRRASAMRVCREVPKVQEKILDETLSLSVLSQAQTFIRCEEKLQGQRMSTEVKQSLIQELENKSSREAEKFLIDKSPQQARLEKIRPISQDKSELRLTLDQATIDNLEKFKLLMSHKSPFANYSELIKTMSEMVLERMDPERKQKAKRKAAPTPAPKMVAPKVGGRTTSLADEESVFVLAADFESELDPKSNLKSKPQPEFKALVGSSSKREIVGQTDLVVSGLCEKYETRKSNRLSRNQLRQLVWRKSKGQCCYVDLKSKRRCASRFQLQVDHIIGKAKGGSDHPSNLQLLCREHNQWKGWLL